MSTEAERDQLRRLLDDPTGVLGCACGCLHFLEEDIIDQRPVVRFRCAHYEHRLDGTEQTYTNPPNDGAVLANVPVPLPSPEEIAAMAGPVAT